ncbi:Crp/Fnr family transcriptional regulator [Bacteroides sp. 214]|uniref:Crp/Fnr family transcriptional regulator n=1 Tax=Bacteroides sp. 214 TaxID=2302935 RepID=UPI0013D29B4D|nr:Crp/Fnr family transcriptional regulator [Bacteroides sp. 214]NDW13141.1 Crp/Fnr family transcriptional regulator [Bacteroides sp. 214]
MNTMFNTLLQLPLFQGLCEEDFTKILAKVKLHFIKYKKGDVIIREDTICDRLVFLLKGEIVSNISSEKEMLVFQESFSGKHLIEPQSLFGLNNFYTATYTAQTEVNVLSISKSFVVKELMNYEIFRINFINIISNRAQNLQRRMWTPRPNCVKEKIIYFFFIHAEKFEGKKVLKIKMNDLAHNLNDTRLNVSRALNELQEEGLLVLHRKEIIAPEMERLLAKVNPIYN